MPLQNMVRHFTERLVVVLILHGRAFPRMYLYTGLRQGCPLSCIIYVIIVDPFLEHVARRQGVDVVTGFCDDWNVLGEPHARQQVELDIREFDECSGQHVKQTKTKPAHPAHDGS